MTMKKPQLTQRNDVFNQNVQADVVFGHYDLSKRSTGSFKMGILYPIYCCNNITPGDKFELKAAPILRLMPMAAPAFTNIDVEVRYFFVPRRLLWQHWKEFISPNRAGSLTYVEPKILSWDSVDKPSLIYNVAGSIFDYMGQSCIPWNLEGGTNGVYGNKCVASSPSNPWYDRYVGDLMPAKKFTGMLSTFVTANPNTAKPFKMSAYPYGAYNMIWNEYFRDENLQQSLFCDLYDGDNPAQEFYLRRVNWEKDYFTSALPWVTQSIFSTPTVQAGDTIEQLREASALTRWLELQAIGGHRYQESILTHFGVRVPDEAAQIPIYLGGGKCPVMIDSVEQTSSTDQQHTPLATLGGKGTASDFAFVDKIEFKEHGTLLGLMYIRPKAVYADVTPRDLVELDSRHDYLWPSFVNLGDEAVKSFELSPGYFQMPGDYGYQMRYARYRTSFDQVHGQLRPGEPLEAWTQARSWQVSATGATFDDVLAAPQLSNDMIACKPSPRIFADTSDSDVLVGDVVTLVDAVRPCPSYVDPKID